MTWRDLVYPLFTWVVGPVVGFLVLRWRLKAENRAYEERQQIQAQEPPIATLKTILESRDRELTAMREQFMTLVTNHLEHDRQEREAAAAAQQNVVEAVTGLQGQQQATMEALSALNAKLDAEIAAVRALTDKVTATSERVAKLEGAAGT